LTGGEDLLGLVVFFKRVRKLSPGRAPIRETKRAKKEMCGKGGGRRNGGKETERDDRRDN